MKKEEKLDHELYEREIKLESKWIYILFIAIDEKNNEC